MVFRSPRRTSGASSNVFSRRRAKFGDDKCGADKCGADKCGVEMSSVDIFSAFRLGPLDLPNRVVMAPMTRNRAGPGNVPTQLNATYYAQRAGAGLIVAEASQVSPQGLGYPATPGIHSAEQVAGWKLATDGGAARR